MDILREDIDALNATLTVKLSKEDYLETVTAELKKLRKQVDMKGFRKGNVPIGLVKKMYGNSVLYETIDKQVSGGLNDYIKEKEMNILARPLMVLDDNLKFDINAPADYEFKYEIGIAPEFDIPFLEKKTAVPKYDIEVDETFIEKELTQLRKRFGEMEHPEDDIQEDDVLVVQLKEIFDAETKEEGVDTETSFALDQVKDEKIKKKLLKLKPGKQLKVKIDDLFEKDKETVLRVLLKVEEEKIATTESDFDLTLTRINRVQPAVMEQTFFDQVYGPNTVDSEEAFMEKFRGDLDELVENRSQQRLKVDIYNRLMDSTEMDFPEVFLKKYIRQFNEQPLTEEQIEEGFENFVDEMKWSLIRDRLMKENEITIEQTDILDQAKEDVKKMYAQYMGMEINDEEATMYSANMLKDEKYVNETYSKLLENRLFDYLTGQIKTKEEKISFEDFTKLN